MKKLTTLVALALVLALPGLVTAKRVAKGDELKDKSRY